MSTVCFKVFDGDRDGRLSEAEVRLMVDTLHAMSAEVSEAGQYPRTATEGSGGGHAARYVAKGLKGR